MIRVKLLEWAQIGKVTQGCQLCGQVSTAFPDRWKLDQDAVKRDFTVHAANAHLHDETNERGLRGVPISFRSTLRTFISESEKSWLVARVAPIMQSLSSSSAAALLTERPRLTPLQDVYRTMQCDVRMYVCTEQKLLLLWQRKRSCWLFVPEMGRRNINFVRAVTLMGLGNKLNKNDNGGEWWQKSVEKCSFKYYVIIIPLITHWISESLYDKKPKFII